MKRFELGTALADDFAFADFEFDTPGIEQRIVENLAHDIGKSPVHELLRRNVDRDREVRQLELALPSRQLAAGRRDDPLAGRVNQSGAFEDRQEPGRRQQAEARMLPAQQGFEADEAS